MALQTSGPISLNDIAGEFGGTVPHALSEYYGKDTAPASGTISLNDFYGLSDAQPFTARIFMVGEGGNSGSITDSSNSLSGGGAGGIADDFNLTSVSAGSTITVTVNGTHSKISWNTSNGWGSNGFQYVSVVSASGTDSVTCDAGGNGGTDDDTAPGPGGGASMNLNTFTYFSPGTRNPGGDGAPFSWDCDYPCDPSAGGGAVGDASGNTPGSGFTSNITGSNVEYGKGGTGSEFFSSSSGSNGSNYGDGGNAPGTNASNGSIRYGASGVVYIRIPTANAAASTTGSPNISTVSSDTLYRFTSSGSITF